MRSQGRLSGILFDIRLFVADSLNDPIIFSTEQDERGQMNDDTVHWVVFLFGNQRCLLFTDEIEIASAALNAVESERINQELKFSLSSIDLSLVDDVRKKEVAYMSLARYDEGTRYFVSM